MKKAIVVDSIWSGLGISAKARANIDPSLVVISASSFCSPNGLLRHLSSSGYSLVLFTWRFVVRDLASGITTHKLFKELRSRVPLGVLIPDHQGLNSKMHSTELDILEMVDFYFVTSEILRRAYDSFPYSEKNLGLLHDLPDIQMIRKVRNLNNIRFKNRLIWVGNSEWGKRQGYSDHKGLQSIFKPLLGDANIVKNEFSGEIVDSNFDQIPNSEVLTKISQSTFLLQTSESEGTGLPILEACGLGIPPITTDVGIARELLGERFPHLIAEHSKDSFIQAISLNFPFEGSQELIDRFEEYIKECEHEQIVWSGERTNWETSNSISKKIGLLFLFKWFWRYRKSLRSRENYAFKEFSQRI